METNTEAIQAKWRELTEEYEPAIRAARAELEEAEREFSAARERRNEAVDHHGKLVIAYNDEWEIVSKTGGKG